MRFTTNRLSRLFNLALIVPLALSCQDIRLSGRIEGAGADTLVLEKLCVSYTRAVDTLLLNEDGRFSCKVRLETANPDFYYLNYRGNRLATLLLKKGDKVQVQADTLGYCTVEGSEESARLMESDREFASISAKSRSIAVRLSELPQNTSHAANLRRQLADNYVRLYRSSIRYIVENNHSLTSVPVIFRKLGDLPVFSQRLDALHFRSLADTLSTLYPTSPYVRALRKEAEAREKQMAYDGKIDSVAVVGFPDIELPDLRSEKVKLSALPGKVVVLHFWTSTDSRQKLFNQDVLKPLYERYHAKGLDIYEVALDADKFGWAQVVKAQNMPWTNVCDIRGGASPTVMLYNVGALPTTYLIVDGALAARQPADAASLRSLVASYLK